MGSFRRLLLLSTTAALLALGTATARADTLWTSTGYTAGVTTGATAHLTSGTATLTGTLGSTPQTDVCADSALTIEIGQNGSGLVSATVKDGSFSSCSTGVPTGNFPWRVTVRGTATVSGSDTVYLNTTWDGVSISAFATFTGSFTDAIGSPPSTGAYAKQPAAAGSPVCFALANAGTLSAGPFTDVRLNATYCPSGGAATTWTLAPPPSFLRGDPSGATIPSGSTISSGGGGGFIMGTGTVGCTTLATGITVGASGGPAVSGTFDRLTLTGCTSSIPGVAVTTCARFVAGASPLTFLATSATAGVASVTNLYVRCGLATNSTGCYYNAPSLSGSYSNTAVLQWIGPATHQAPVGVTDDTGTQCGSTGTVAIALIDVTTGSGTVTLRQS
jgi:hypothetical protein